MAHQTSAAHNLPAARIGRTGPQRRARMTAEPAGDYDAYAEEFRAHAAERERGGPDGDPVGIAPRLPDWLGDVAGLRVLDAGCGDGYPARFLAGRCPGHRG